jgi:hypothetical protein
MDLAECGLESPDRLTRILGASLQDHVDEIDVLADAHKSALDRIRDLERTVDELEAQNARFADIIKTLAKA